MFCGLLVLASTGAARAQTGLEFKFRPGEKLKYSLTAELKDVVNSNGVIREQKVNQRREIEWLVLGVNEGKGHVNQKITRFIEELEAPGGQAFKYDSKDGKKPEGPLGAKLGPILEAFSTAEFNFKMEPNGEMSDMKISEKFLAAYMNNPELADLRDIFTEEGIKRQLSHITLSFPKEPVTPGKVWSKSIEVKAPFGTMKFTNTFTHKGAEKVGNSTYDKIELKTEISTEPDPAGEGVTTVKSQNSKGVIYFDGQRGIIVESSQNQEFELEVKAMDGTVTMTKNNVSKFKLLP